MQAIRKSWADDLQVQLQALLARNSPRPAPAATGLAAIDLRPSLAPVPSDDAPSSSAAAISDENVVSFSAFNRQQDPAVPEPLPPPLPIVVPSLSRATELLRQAEQQSGRKVQQALDLAFRTVSQLEAAEASLDACQATIRDLTLRSQAIAETAAAQVNAADARLREAAERIAALDHAIEELTGELEETRAHAAAADRRASDAAADAAHARSELNILAERVCEALSFAEQPGAAA